MASSDFPDRPDSATTARPSVLWHPATQDCAPLSRLLHEKHGMSILTDRTQAEVRLKAEPHTRLLVLHQGPLAALSQAMAEGTPPSTALAQWTEAARETLTLIRRHRAQVLVLETSAAARHPEAASALLGLPAGTLTAPSSPTQEEAVFTLLAAHSLQADPAAQDLASEIEASAADFSNGAEPPRIDTDALFETQRAAGKHAAALQEKVDRGEALNTALRKQVDQDRAARKAAEKHAAALRQDLKGAESRNALLEKQSSVMQHEMEHLLAQREQLQQRLDQVNHGLDSYHAQITDLRSKLEIREGRLNEKNREIEALAGRMHTLTTQSDELQRRIEATQAHIDGIRRSKSYRLMAPLRRLRAATLRKGSGNV